MTVRVLIVDDSATMRSLIAATLRQDPQIEVVGQVGDAIQARQAIKSLNPDVVTLDVEMPNMNGLDFLEKIMRLRPTPVIMVSSLTQSGAAATIRALEIGAVDCVSKPSVAGLKAFDQLGEKVKAAAGARLRPFTPSAPAIESTRSAPFTSDVRVVAIGASTGGVEALISVLSRFPADCPPTVITQHMPAAFTKGFAQRLDRLCAPQISEAVDGAPLKPGRVYLAPGGLTHLEVAGSSTLRCRLSQGEPVNGHRPSVDVLFRTVADAAGVKSIGVLLTGMGRDGAEGLLAMRRAGGQTLAQDEASCVVYGMPKAALALGGVERQLPLTRIGDQILRLAAARHTEKV